MPIAGSVALTDVLAGASIITTAATGKGTTEIALDLVTGQDCRLIEGALREDRNFCEEQGSPATKEDFKGLASWVEESEPGAPVPGNQPDATIMVAAIGPPEAYSNTTKSIPADSVHVQTSLSTVFQPEALASLSELPNEWIILASVEYSSEAAGFAAITPSSGAPGLAELKSGDIPLPFLPSTQAPNLDVADWAVESLPQGPSGLAEKAFTLPDAESAPFLPTPAKPAQRAFPPHPEKPVLQVELPDSRKNAWAIFTFALTTG